MATGAGHSLVRFSVKLLLVVKLYFIFTFLLKLHLLFFENKIQCLDMSATNPIQLLLLHSVGLLHTAHPLQHHKGHDFDFFPSRFYS